MPRRGNHEGTYRRKGRGWQAAIRLGGQRYWVSGRTRRECQEKLLALIERHRRGQLAPPLRLTLGEWCDLWLREGEARWRPTTLRRRRQVLSPLLLRMGGLRLSRLEPLHLAAALEELRREGMGTRSLELCWDTLHACLEEAVRRGLLGYNPMQRVPRPRHQPREARDWTLEDMRRFLGAALGDERPLAWGLALVLLTGLRVGELLGLRWEDIDWSAGALQVRRSVTWAGKEWHVSKPKSKSGERVLSLPSLALRLLERLPRDSVYLLWRQRPPAPKEMSDLMRQLCERAGVPRRPPHYLRHAHSSVLVSLGLDVKTLQRRLGHASASVTLDVYAYALGEMDRQAAEVLDRALGA
jgi:integrase